jgi:anti-anti-sigma factor
VQLEVNPAPGGPTHLIVSGEVDLSTAPRLRAAGVAAITAPECTGLAVDLSAVSFLDSSGVGALVAVRSAGAGLDRAVTIVNPSGRVRQVIDICGLAAEFGLEPTASLPVGDP